MRLFKKVIKMPYCLSLLAYMPGVMLGSYRITFPSNIGSLPSTIPVTSVL